MANTDERKKIWVLINDERSQEDIAKEARVGRRTVNIFIAILVAADLVVAKRGQAPKRVLKYVPPSWLDLVQLPGTEPTEDASRVQSAVVNQTVNEGAGDR